MNKTLDEGIKPRLKSGALITALSGTQPQSYYIGHLNFGIEVSHPGTSAIIENFTGQLNCLEISAKTGAPFAVVLEICEQLVAANLIDQVSKPIVLSDRYHSEKENRRSHLKDQSKDVAYQQLQKRVSSELGQITWQSGIVDAGVNTLSTRQNIAIDICGDDRVAISLLTILLASGVAQTTLAISNIAREITPSDLGNGVFKISDLGSNLTNRIIDLSHEYSLFPIPKNSNATRALTIIFGAPDPVKISALLSADLPHLFISSLSATTVKIGPLVIPGKSPCYRCLELTQQENFPLLNQINQALSFAPLQQLNIAASHQLAGTIAQLILNFLDTGISELIGTQILYDSAHPCNPDHIAYAINPSCGCTW
jgi:hypothetical protein